MSASPRFGGRWAYVGYITKQYTERARMSRKARASDMRCEANGSAG